jgi:hypothetical protein
MMEETATCGDFPEVEKTRRTGLESQEDMAMTF